MIGQADWYPAGHSVGMRSCTRMGACGRYDASRAARDWVILES